MIRELRYSCPLPNGMHARPASVLAETARRFRASVTVVNEATGVSADAQSVLSVIGLDIARETSVVIRVEGDDAAAAAESIDALFADRFGEAEAAAETGMPETHAVVIPRPFRNWSVRTIPGRAVSRGIGIGQAVVLRNVSLPEHLADERGASPDQERRSLSRAVAQVRGAIEGRIAASRSPTEQAIARAHSAMLDDAGMRSRIDEQIGRGVSVAGAVVLAARHFTAQLRACSSAYVRDRVDDIEDLASQLVAQLVPDLARPAAPKLSGPSVVVADTLTVGQLGALDAAHLRGLVLGRVGETAHTVILARSMNIPTLVGVENARGSVREGQQVIADARDRGGGFAVVDPDARVHAYYTREHEARTRARARMEPIVRRPGRTADGVALDVAANAAGSAEVAGAMAQHADGIGLLRTELLFLDRSIAPSEQEQFDAYRAAVEHARGKEVVIRTLDIGGDKPAPYLHLPREENPFLGKRGIRLYEQFADLITAQLRAVCRASAHGKVKVMAPMVANVSEATWFVERLRSVQAELKSAGTPFDPHMPVGIMLEVPAACLIVDQLASVVDFFSIGTNDLCQYWMAVDRGNRAVSALHDVRTPSFLRLLDQTVAAARKFDKWIGVCGEMAGDPLNLPLLVGVGGGVSEISVPAPEVGEIKHRLSMLERPACRAVLEEAMACASAADVKSLLERFASGAGGGLGDPLCAETIIASSAATSKEEVIHELCCALHAAGRTSDPRAVEEAVWKREDTYATGLGFGFAIPHGRTDAVSCASIAVAKLAQPVDWGSADGGSGQPVQAAIMLTVRASDAAPHNQTHMKLLAKLARKLMHEEFREHVLTASRPDSLLEYLRRELDLVLPPPSS